MPGGSGYSKLSVPKPKTRIHNIGAHNSPALGLLASTNRKDTAHRTQTGLPPSHSKRTPRFLAHSFTLTETLAQQQQWIDWAIWMCAVPALPLLSKDAMAIYLVSIILIGASRNKP